MKSETRGTRYELKMECDLAMLPQARAWTRLHAAGFYETYPPRQVNNIYFDTPGMDSFNDHIEGIPARRKLRFRWYGEDRERACGQMELKEKNERVGWKLVQPVDAVLDLGGQDWSDIQGAILEGLAGGQDLIFREMLNVSRPLVVNSYQREYYVSANEQVRLTLDYEMNAYNQWLAARPNLTFGLPVLDRMMVELKCDVEHSRYLADVLAQFPLRVNRHSKYISALDPLLER